jgi:hypothetical protein
MQTILDSQHAESQNYNVEESRVSERDGERGRGEHEAGCMRHLGATNRDISSGATSAIGTSGTLRTEIWHWGIRRTKKEK